MAAEYPCAGARKDAHYSAEGFMYYIVEPFEEGLRRRAEGCTLFRGRAFTRTDFVLASRTQMHETCSSRGRIAEAFLRGGGYPGIIYSFRREDSKSGPL